MLVLSSPSGAGKTTISRALLERDGNLSHVGLRDDAADAAGREGRRATIISSIRRDST